VPTTEEIVPSSVRAGNADEQPSHSRENNDEKPSKSVLVPDNSPGQKGVNSSKRGERNPLNIAATLGALSACAFWLSGLAAACAFWLSGLAAACAFWLSGLAAACADAAPPARAARMLYASPRAPVEARVDDLLRRLTPPEKLTLLAEDSIFSPLTLQMPPIPRLNIPVMHVTDSSQGLRGATSTAFPVESVMAATWNPALIGQVGASVGQEAKAYGNQLVYGPCVNIHRSPQDGRNFESFSEDPFLTARLGVRYIQGMQSQGVAACVKHFACNNQETFRHFVSVHVDDRSLHEIYLPAFQAAAQEAHAWSLMTALNQINGVYAAESRPLLTGLLKQRWGWDGAVFGDWGAIHDAVAAANAGTDIEVPKPMVFTTAALGAALKSGAVTQTVVDGKVRRILRLMVRTGLLDGSPPPGLAAVNSPAHQALARKVAQQGIVLLKNANGLLPLDRAKLKSIAVIGPNAADTQLGGRWSADVHPAYQVGVLDGIRKHVTGAVTVGFAQGCPRTLPGTPAALAEAAALAAKSDVAVVVVGMDNNYEGEELDPPNLNLPGDQDKLIQAIAAANKNTIVVLNNGTSVLMKAWLTQVSGLVDMGYAGQEMGNALADILFGDINPSGRLPDTLAARREDYSDWENYPGRKGIVRYAEGVYVGYRHFNHAQVLPLFPFGFGLSYTTFQYRGLRVPARLARAGVATVRVRVKNTGTRAGDEVVQLYVGAVAPNVDRPVRELKGFRRISLRPGEETLVSFTLNARAFSYWDSARQGWRAEPGRYSVELGSSSRDMHAAGQVVLQ